MKSWLWALACPVALGIIILAGFAHESPAKVSKAVQAVAWPVSVRQPLTAAQVAASLGCNRFKPGNPGQSGLVVTAGSCWMHGTKYAIDTFQTSDIRDAWLRAAEPLGVVPAYQSPNAVVYKSIG